MAKKYSTKVDFKTTNNQTATAVPEDKGTATRLKPLKSDDGVVSMLMRIFTFMNKNYQDDKLHREEVENLKEGQEIAAKRRHDKLLAAIEDMKKKLAVTPKTATKEEPDEGPGLLSWITNFFGGAAALQTILKLGSMLISPLGLAILGVGSIAALLLLDNKPEETNKGLQTALGGPAMEAQAITEAASDEIAHKKSTILREATKAGKIESSIWHPIETAKNQQAYLNSIGWDDVTGTTQEERAKATTTESKPKTVPQQKSAAPVTTPTSAKLNNVTSENNSMKIEAATSSPTVSTTNNVNATAGKTERPMVPRIKIPAVRNQEETFQRMIVYSTRVV